MLLIGLTGKAGSGKDTVGDMLLNWHDFGTTSFAWPIKNAIAKMLGVDEDIWENRVWKETPLPSLGVTPRFMAQTLGTEWGRDCIGQDIWVKLALERITRSECSRIAITDVRFENEARMVRENGILVHIDRLDTTTIDNANHLSEAGIVSVKSDIHIENHGSLASLRIMVDLMMHEVLKRLQAIEAEEEEVA